MKHTDTDKDILLKKINLILLKEWDPIGIHGIDGAENEYISYANQLSNIILGGKTINDVFNYLVWAENERMGLDCDFEHTTNIAKKLMQSMGSAI